MSKSKTLTVGLLLLLGVFVVVLLKNAWIGDDAYITFRTIANFVYGYGLRYNIIERVQTYTHPLWLFLLSAFYFFTREPYYTTIYVSLGLSLATVCLVAFGLARDRGLAILTLVLIIFSKAFIDYSTSGLENPLTHFILALYLLVFFSSKLSEKKVLHLSFLAGLGTLNRMDTILFYLPVLLYTMWQIRQPKVLYLVFLGFSPFILWECFSTFYYGFPLPNTAYAKLGVGIPHFDLMKQGFYYLWDSLKVDPLTLASIVVATISALLGKNNQSKVVVVGIVLYLLYLIYIGGDFMSGRFLAAPFLIAIIVISRLQLSFLIILLLVFFVSILGVLSPFSPVLNGADYGKHLDHFSISQKRGVLDERGWYNSSLGYLNASKSWRVSAPNKWSAVRVSEKEAEFDSGLFLATSIGFSGYSLGPGPLVVDFVGLASPFLARLAVVPVVNWRPGHFERCFPAGYYETLKSGHNQLKNKNLMLYYKKLCLVTRGKLFSFARIKEIINFNLGRNDYLLEGGCVDSWRQAKDQGILFSTVSFAPIPLSGVSHAKKIQITLRDNYPYTIAYLRENNFIAFQNVEMSYDRKRGRRTCLTKVPPLVWQQGYDALTIIVLKSYSNDVSFVGWVKLID